MITFQKIEITWTKDARGGRLASLRNAVPGAFEISSDRKSQDIENCITVNYESIRIEDTATDKLISVVGNVMFAVENSALLIKTPEYNSYDRQLAILHHAESIQFIRFRTSIGYSHDILYHKSIANLVFSNGNIPLDYFTTQPFKYRFDEKSGIWHT